MFDFFSENFQLFATEFIYIIPENISFVKGIVGEVAYPSLSRAVVFVQTKLQACSLAGTGQVKRHLTWRGNSKGKIAWLVKRRMLPTGLGE